MTKMKKGAGEKVSLRGTSPITFVSRAFSAHVHML